MPYLGLYQIDYDSVAPSITILNNTRSFSKGESINFRIKDNFEVIGLAEELKISQHLDDQWVVGNYDLKSHTLRIPIQKNWSKGRHILSIIAEDDKVNISRAEFEISIQ